MIDLPAPVHDAPVPCFRVPELNRGCTGCMFFMEEKSECLESGNLWREGPDNCGTNRAVYIPATREAFDAHQLKLIAARLIT